MSFNPALRWSDSPSPNVSKYIVQWTKNGALAAAQNVPFGTSPYTTHWSDSNPTPLVAGDVVSATVTADDTTDSLLSVPVSTPNLTIPSATLSPPANVTLALT